MTKTGRKTMLARHHTGKVRPHAHTSYKGLALVLLVAAVPLIAISNTIVSANPEDDAVSASYGTYAVVEGPTPKVAPTISNIATGKVYNAVEEAPIRGNCPGNTLVKVFKNEVFAGAALCQNGSYQMSIGLFVGANTLVARAYNTNDAVSPDSTPVVVQLNVAGADVRSTNQLATAGAAASQFYVSGQISHRGVQAGDSMSWPLTLVGGQAPYAVSVSWGDGKSDVISRASDGTFDISHTYAKSGGYRGSYTIVVKATDQAGAKSYMQLVSIVSSDKPKGGVVGTVTGGYGKSLPVMVAWQVMAALVVLLLGFWIGEKREAKLLKRRAA